MKLLDMKLNSSRPLWWVQREGPMLLPRFAYSYTGKAFSIADEICHFEGYALCGFLYEN
jgi:hypothetical protein